VPEDCSTAASFGFTNPCRPALSAALGTAARVLGWYGLALVGLEALVLLITSLLFYRIQVRRADLETSVGAVEAEPRVYRQSATY
jgi:hypothetical protein